MGAYASTTVTGRLPEGGKERVGKEREGLGRKGKEWVGCFVCIHRVAYIECTECVCAMHIIIL